MSDDSKKKRVVSSLLLASAMAVPSMALDQKAVDEIALKAASKQRTSEVKILDSQSKHEKLNRVIAPNWGRVWGKITWARIIEEM